MDLSAAGPNDLFEEEAEMKGISTASAAAIVHTNAHGQIVHQGELMAAPFNQARGEIAFSHCLTRNVPARPGGEV